MQPDIDTQCCSRTFKSVFSVFLFFLFLQHCFNNNGFNERASAHVSYDEAHMSATTSNLPPMAVALQQAGYRKEPYSDNTSSPVEPGNLKIKLNSEKATTPTRGTPDSAGLDFYSAENAVIAAGKHKLIHTDISMEIPKGHYGKLSARSGLALKNRIDVKAGVIDSDYRGEIGIILENNGNEDFDINIGNRIAQMVILKCPNMTIDVTDSLVESDRGASGFGSTGIKKDHIPPPLPLPPEQSPLLESTTAAAAKLVDHDDIIPPCNVELCTNPFLDNETIPFDIRGEDPTQGLNLSMSKHWDNIIFINGTNPGSGC